MLEKVIFYYSKKAFKNYRKRLENVSASDGTKTWPNRVIIHLRLIGPVIHMLKCAAPNPDSINRNCIFEEKPLCCYYCGISKTDKSRKIASSNFIFWCPIQLISLYCEKRPCFFAKGRPTVTRTAQSRAIRWEELHLTWFMPCITSADIPRSHFSFLFLWEDSDCEKIIASIRGEHSLSWWRLFISILSTMDMKGRFVFRDDVKPNFTGLWSSKFGDVKLNQTDYRILSIKWIKNKQAKQNNKESVS